MKKIVVLLLAVFVINVCKAAYISIIVSDALIQSTITSTAINDVRSLISQACGCEVSINDSFSAVQIILPDIDSEKANALNRFALNASFPYRNFPEHNYAWTLTKADGRTYLNLKAESFQGASFGLYGLLQEKLGFRFYHPRNTIIPHWEIFPLSEPFLWEAKALFDKHGFHLHTQHPLELTEQLHDGTIPNSLEDVKEYINWLVRNGQNYFEFCLLESVNRKEWPAHSKAIVDYAHSRGIMTAVDLSLHMIQQKTFQLYKGPTAKKKQIEKNLKWLLRADWDFINMEFSTAEFIAGNKKKKEELRLLVIEWLKKNSNTKLMGRQHVVKHENEAGHKRKDFEWDSTSNALDKERGVLSHTVMFYSMTEESAPVYENKNQRHMFDFLLQQMKERETWYYPESAYWVTFDLSVPMLLLPYLNARLSDIDTCVAYKVPGHITFTSGWEWGGWLIDWSIARWSWQHTFDEKPQQRTALMYANEVCPYDYQKEFLQTQLDLQQHYLKDSSLMKWMTAMTITDEIGIKALNDAYHPRPEWSYKFIQRDADLTLLKKLEIEAVNPLYNFAENGFKNSEVERWNYGGPFSELKDGIQITLLRALHRSTLLEYIIQRRKADLEKHPCNCDSLLNTAVKIRMKAQEIVNNRQQNYRYPLHLIAEKRWDHTSYHFGYLYPVSNLHFWHREEEEARKNKYSPLFMNIWNMFRIAGIIN